MTAKMPENMNSDPPVTLRSVKGLLSPQPAVLEVGKRPGSLPGLSCLETCRRKQGMVGEQSEEVPCKI